MVFIEQKSEACGFVVGSFTNTMMPYKMSNDESSQVFISLH